VKGPGTRRTHRVTLSVVWLFVGSAVILGSASAAAQGVAGREENWRRCRDANADARISGCTALIQSGAEAQRDLAIAYHNRGTANRAKQLLDLALQDYDEAITQDPRFADAIGDRGITLTAMGRYAEAIPDFTQVIDLDPRSGYALYDRGLAYEGLGLDDLAIADFSAAIDQEPRDARRFERRGTVYFRTAQFDKARADYEQALTIDPQYAPALYGRGIVKRIQGDPAGAGADIAQATHFQADIDRVMSLAGVKEQAAGGAR
jgi:tetratricopeptide (TPR) repeat protein